MALGTVAGARPGPLPGASGTGAPGTQAQKHVGRQRDKVQPRQTAPGYPSGRPHAPAGEGGMGGVGIGNQTAVDRVGLFSHTTNTHSFYQGNVR